MTAMTLEQVGLAVGDLVSASMELWQESIASPAVQGHRMRLRFYNASDGVVDTYETDPVQSTTPTRVALHGIEIPPTTTKINLFHIWDEDNGKEVYSRKAILVKGPQTPLWMPGSTQGLLAHSHSAAGIVSGEFHMDRVPRVANLRGFTVSESPPSGGVNDDVWVYTGGTPVVDADRIQGRQVHTVAPSDGDAIVWNAANSRYEFEPAGDEAVWGNITGALANQTDLQSALNDKSDITHNHHVASLDGFTVSGSLPSGGSNDDVWVYTGGTPIIDADKIQGRQVHDAAPSDGQGLIWNNAESRYEPGDVGDAAVWGNITGTLADQTDLQSALDGKAAASHTHAASEITSGVLNNARVPRVPALLGFTVSGSLPSGGQNDDVWVYTGGTPVVDADKLQGFAVHDAAPSDGEALVWVAANSRYEPGPAGGLSEVALSDITGFGSAGGYIRSNGSAWVRVSGVAWGDLTSIPAFGTRWPTWSEVTSKPSTFPPDAHTHAASDITSGTLAYARLPISSTQVSNWDTAFGWGNHATAGYAAASHTHAASDITSGVLNNARVPRVPALLGFTVSGSLPSGGQNDDVWVYTGGTPVVDADKLQGFAVHDAAPSDGEALVWVAANSRYEPGPAGGGGDVALSDITGFGSAGGYIRSNGSAWVRVSGVAWGDLTSIPAFASRWPTWSEVTSKPSTFPPDAHNHAASEITSGTLAVARGGTNIGSYTTGNYIRASGATTLQQRTPSQVLADIGAAASSHGHTWGDITGASVNAWSSLRVSTSSGYIDFGPANTTNAHIYTDRSRFYMNKDIAINNHTVMKSHHTGTGGGNRTVSTGNPSGGANGDEWLKVA